MRPLNNDVSRRSFLKTAAMGAGAVSIPTALTGCFSSSSSSSKKGLVYEFGHGVASGDPLTDQIIIWTRVTPDDESTDKEAEVAWVIATDKELKEVVDSGTTLTDKSKDFTVKLDVTGLSPATKYYYQFASEDEKLSPLGETYTLPEGYVESVNMAVCSCSNFTAGFYNAYKEIANSGAQVVIHLGDYIYEYGSNEYPKKGQVRPPKPAHETVLLDDYRMRYASHRIDEDLQELHRLKPFICVWDDHELANDTWKDGAHNHQPDEGDFDTRKNAAIQAYHEWLPIRTGTDKSKIWRSFKFGELVNLTMLDTRIYARSEPLNYADYTTSAGIDTSKFMQDLANTDRTLMGEEQLTYAVENITASNATWEVLGQQIVMGRMNIPIELLQGLATIQDIFDSGKGFDDPVAQSAQKDIMQKLTELTLLKPRLDSPYLTPDEKARVTTTAPYDLDAWDGYPVNREKILQSIQGADKNLVVLAGDSHNAWASNLYPSDNLGQVDRSKGSAGVEFAAPSITSPGFESYVGFSSTDDQKGFETAVTTLVDDLKYHNAANRGYMLVNFTPEEATCQWHYVSTIASKNYTAWVGKTMKVKPGAANRTLISS